MSTAGVPFKTTADFVDVELDTIPKGTLIVALEKATDLPSDDASTQRAFKVIFAYSDTPNSHKITWVSYTFYSLLRGQQKQHEAATLAALNKMADALG